MICFAFACLFVDLWADWYFYDSLLSGPTLCLFIGLLYWITLSPYASFKGFDLCLLDHPDYNKAAHETAPRVSPLSITED